MIHYQDTDILKIVFSALVIKVSSIEKQFESIDNFAKKYGFHGVTNGVLLATSEMCSPPFRLEAFVQEVFIPNGLQPIEDFVFIDELLSSTAKDLKNVINLDFQPHPDCEKINWLQSLILSNGNFIWYSDPKKTDFEKDATFRLLKNLINTEYELSKLNPRITKIDDTYVHYTVSDSQIHYKKHRDALWYNEAKYVKNKFSDL